MRKIITIITLFLFALILTSCSEYKDTNGEDDYTLQSITDDEIVDDSNYSVIGSFRNVIKNKGSYRVKKINGVFTIDTFSKGTYTFTVDFKVSKGNAKLVLCDDDEIIYEFTVNQDSQSYTISSSTRFYLKVAGENSSLEVKYEYN